MKRKKNGFTFVELMAIIVVIGIVLVLVVPSLIGNMGEAKEQTEIVFVKNIDKQINTFISKYKNEFKVDTENKYSIDGTEVYEVKNSEGLPITFKYLKEKGIIEDFVNPKDSSSCDFDAKIELYRDLDFKYYYRYNLVCLSIKGNFSKLDSESGGSGESGETGESGGTGESGEAEGTGTGGVSTIPGDDGTSQVIKMDNSGANAPDLDTGLVPVRYNGTNWVIIDPKKEQWYDYDKQEWANAVSLAPGVSKEVGTKLKVPDGTSTDSDILAMFVWVPRFSYTIGCHATDNCYGYRMNDVPDTDPGVPSQQLPGAIDIKFIAKKAKDELKYEDEEKTKPIYPTYTYNVDSNGMPTTDRNPTNYYTHPAFDFGGTPLSGIWVGKFETSTDVNASCYNSTTSNCAVGSTEVRILPNVTSMRYQQIANMFAYSQYFSANNIYGLTGDAHMMKNSEWAAVAYLSQSIYGKYGNSDYSGANKEIYINNYYNTDIDGYITGVSAGVPFAIKYVQIACRYNEEGDNRTEGTGFCGPGASTTGNIYGIYDMNGGAGEYVMGNYGKETGGVFTGTKASSEIDFSKINNKYYDKFTTENPFTTKSKQTMGQALYEVTGWYKDGKETFIENYYVWLGHGGSYNGNSSAGVFRGSASEGSAFSINGFRSVFVMTST